LIVIPGREQLELRASPDKLRDVKFRIPPAGTTTIVIPGREPVGASEPGIHNPWPW
jgi:hypothetical protein